jgi:hypothetical protein
MDAERRDEDDRSTVANNNLPGLLEGFQGMAKSGRKPSREAYLALLDAAADYSMERGNADVASSNERSLEDGELTPEFLQEQGETGLGWQLAWCTWQDARLGDIDLGIEGLDLLIKVSLEFNLPSRKICRILILSIRCRLPIRILNSCHLSCTTRSTPPLSLPT